MFLVSTGSDLQIENLGRIIKFFPQVGSEVRLFKERVHRSDNITTHAFLLICFLVYV